MPAKSPCPRPDARATQRQRHRLAGARRPKSRNGARHRTLVSRSNGSRHRIRRSNAARISRIGTGTAVACN
eukprot:159504-Lingulodinium_polyedra.AAC.1